MKLESTFKHRNLWLGFAMLVIMLYHSQFICNSRLYAMIRQYGYAGVDIFVFASGIGCYYSLDKDSDVLRFLQRRLRKLGPVYLCFNIPWLLWRKSQITLPKSAIIGNILGLETFVLWEYHFNWYIGALILFYFLMPYLKRLTDSCRTLVGDALVVFLLVVVSMPFWNPADLNMAIYARLPILYLGAVSAKLAKRGLVLNHLHYIAVAAAAVAGLVMLQVSVRFLPDLLWWRGLYWYPFFLIVPGICLLLSCLGEVLRKYRPLHGLYWVLERMGIYSFELYLVHAFLYAYLMEHITPMLPNIPWNLLWAMTIPVILVGCFLLNRSAALLSWVFAKIAGIIAPIL